MEHIPFSEIESKWRKRWADTGAFRAPKHPKSGKKFYCLDMFPYPSAAGLHVGHPEGYTATDILCRYRRRKGDDVLHPMGWDAFGLPAENFALQTGTHPRIVTQNNIANFKRQIQALGFSYDWDREIDTTDPNYYRWTQWIFLQLFKKGLAYEGTIPINWCPSCKTGLANEEVFGGACERCGTAVERRDMRQWLLKITAYADRLLADLEGLDWPESTLAMQRNWIGKSEGAQVQFKVHAPGLAAHGKSFEIFTTRPDTLYGATYMVLAPEHSLVRDLTAPDQRKAVEDYVAAARGKSDLERSELQKDKTGVFTGAGAIHPLTGKEIPIWIADYVLAGYGTGAIMAVPAHDERDFEFARKFHLPVVEVVREASPASESAPSGKRQAAGNAGVERAYMREGTRAVLPGTEKDVAGRYAPGTAGREHDLSRGVREAAAFCDDGVAVNSPLINDLPTPKAKEKMIEALEQKGIGRRKVSYKLRDWVFSRQRYWGEPIPVIHCAKCGIVPVPEKDLPVLLPEIKDFKPTGTGESPLAAVKDWVATTCPSCKSPAKRETNTMPQWAGSCWYYLRFMDPRNSERAWSVDAEKAWGPVDCYVGGSEHAVLHLLYARFWHKVLFDLGFVSTKEPFQKLRHQGMIVSYSYRDARGNYHDYSELDIGEAGRAVLKSTGEKIDPIVEKMSKSKKNVINPDEVLARYGADAFRMYEMFMGPFEDSKPWDMQSIEGIARFLRRVWTNFSDGSAWTAEEGLARPRHRAIAKVSSDIEQFGFNTAISALMIYSNEILKAAAASHACANPKADAIPWPIARADAETFLTLLNPFAPHLTEEIWERSGHKTMLSQEPWPAFNPELLKENHVEVAVQVNGKVKGHVQIEANSPEDKVREAALSLPRVQEAAAGRSIVKVVIVPNRLVNIVVK